MICRYVILKESRISVGRNYVNELYIGLDQIAFCQQSGLESKPPTYTDVLRLATRSSA